ncbi:MAG TPA: helical backbone metal receptor [Polyangiaceae bacterium]|nr:helical backbone metal receptor [Polyangiaceae bacterium]
MHDAVAADVDRGHFRHGLFAAVLLAVLCSALAWGLHRLVPTATQAPLSSPPVRIVSLSPGITETLFAIGAGDRVVAVSDYCAYPPPVRELPRAGTAITPQYERIARLNPDLIVTQTTQRSAAPELDGLGPTERLPWLELDEIAKSTLRLGELTGRQAQAAALADRLLTSLSKPPPPAAPRVLLVLGYAGTRLSEVWFVRDNSLHGAALRAARARNAVPEAVAGLPRMSLERVLEIDPDQIIVLSSKPLDASATRQVLEAWRGLPSLAAVEHGRIGVIDAEGALANGPRILDFVERLRALIGELATR